jgi:transposase
VPSVGWSRFARLFDHDTRRRSGISDQTICGWRRQELIDTGQLPGLNRAEQAELSAANKRIRELETEVAILKKACELLREPHHPKGGTRL